MQHVTGQPPDENRTVRRQAAEEPDAAAEHLAGLQSERP